MRSDADRVSDILEAIEKIKARTPANAVAFQQDELVQVWVIHHLQVIGEAARALSPSLRERHPDVPWAEIIALRNILVHEYFGLNMEQVWTLVQRDLPKLEQQVRRIRLQIGGDLAAEA
jgi:uncharacterized protein with HEPN domain